MRHFKQVAVAAGSAALVLAGAAGASAATSHTSAGTSRLALRGGSTSVTTGKGIAVALLSNGIVPVAVSPGAEALRPNLSAPAVRLTFPVTGGRVSLSPLGGNIDHRGGILFFSTKTGKDIEVSNFIISLKHADLTGIVNGNRKARVVLMWLNLSHAKLRVYRHVVIATNIGVRLSGTAAHALDASLGTTLFTAGLPIGTASTTVRF